MDDIARYNRERWEELPPANVLYSQPWLDLDEASARDRVDPEGGAETFSGKDVLCLAGGGGQQSAALALLGANVTVLDLSETQLERDRQAGRHYGLEVSTVQGDMRDLCWFGQATFDIVWHAHSLNFVPEARPVFREVARVLREAGLYRLTCWNPLGHGIDHDDWNGSGYPLRLPYVDGAEIQLADPHWKIPCDDGTCNRVRAPREFRHTLSSLLNGLVEHGFVLLAAWEDTGDDPEAEPGTWQHFMSVAAPWLTFWARYGPPVFEPK